jgi:hypothetical protein
MSKTRLAVLGGLILGLIFGLGLLVGIVLPRMAGLGSTPRTYNTAVLLRQVQTLSQLVTVKYVLEKVVILDDPPQNPVRRLLPDETRVILVAHGIVKAGVDLSRLKSGDLKLSGNRIEITLPPAQVTDSYLDDAQTKVIERNTSFLRDFNKDLEQNARQTAVDDIRRAAKSSGILKDADDRARAQLRLLFEELGFEVEFR